MLAYFLLGRERLQSYSVHEKPNPAADRVDRAEALEFVKDGFVFPAFVVPPLWLAGHGIWLGVLAYAACAAVIFALTLWLALPAIFPALAMLVVHLIFGSEADEMQRSHLTARGWTAVGQVTGTGTLDCQRRFYDNWLPSVPMTASGVLSASKLSLNVPTGPAQVSASANTAIPTNAAKTRNTRPGSVLGNLLAPLKRPDGR